VKMITEMIANNIA